MSLIDISNSLSAELAKMSFSEPVTHVYDPVIYAQASHRIYLERFGKPGCEAVFLGMNPGPWGMAQTGVPFGEIASVKDWMGISAQVEKPAEEHPKRPIEGFDCARSEVSGARLWGYIKERFGTPEAFFKRFFVTNYCPLVFMEESGKNRTPDKLPKEEREPLNQLCDQALRDIIEYLKPEWVIGVGAFAEQRAKKALKGIDLKIGRVLHPSPASPIANRGWAPAAQKDMEKLGIRFEA